MTLQELQELQELQTSFKRGCETLDIQLDLRYATDSLDALRLWKQKEKNDENIKEN